MSSGLGAALVLCAIFASPVAAAAHRPDGWVRYEGLHDTPDNIDYPQPGAWKGKDIYNTTALSQTATHKGPYTGINGYHWFTITIQNDGGSDRFKVKGTVARQGDGTSTKYFKGTTNITSQVKAGTYQTASLAAGAKTTITVRIDSVDPALVTITSVADPTKKDVVKAVIKSDGTCFC